MKKENKTRKDVQIFKSSRRNTCLDFIDMIRYFNFHWCSWAGYYAVIISLYLSDINTMNGMLLICITYLFARNIFLCKKERFSGNHKMLNNWRFNRILCIAIVSSRYLFILWSYPVLDFFGVYGWFNAWFGQNSWLNILGLVPNGHKVNHGWEIIPGCFSIYFSAMMLYRIDFINYTLSKETEIQNISEKDIMDLGDIDPLILEGRSHQDTFGYDGDWSPNHARLSRLESKNSLGCELAESASKLNPNIRGGVIIDDESHGRSMTFDFDTLRLMTKQIECKKTVLGDIKYFKKPS
jgi:hypothetical protein